MKNEPTKHVPRAQTLPFGAAVISWVVSVGLLIALVAFVITHLSEAEHFAKLARQAEPMWLILGAALQVGTYICAGAVWNNGIRAAGHHLKIRTLARLSVIKLTVNQVVPTGGMSGNLVVMRSMHRMGVAGSVAIEAVTLEALTWYSAYALSAVLAIVALWILHSLTPVVIGLMVLFAIVIGVISLFIWWILTNRDWNPPRWLRRLRFFSHLIDSLAEASFEHVKSPRLILKTAVFQLGIFLLDAGTLWAMMIAIGTPVNPLVAFTALVIATIAGTVSFLPGGIGSFEAGCITTMTLLGAPVEAALTGTLLLRGLTLWLPLLPGLFLARHELRWKP